MLCIIIPMRAMKTEATTIKLPIEGMDEHCALMVDKTVGGVPEVQEHHVELNNRVAVLRSERPVEPCSMPCRPSGTTATTCPP